MIKHKIKHSRPCNVLNIQWNDVSTINQGRWDGWGIWHAQGRTEIYKEYCWRNLNERSRLERRIADAVSRAIFWVCGRSLAGIAGSNPAGSMDVYLLWVLCVVRYRCLRQADQSFRGVLPSVVRLRVISKPSKVRKSRPTHGCWAVKKGRRKKGR
jgi:hypothetical protein